MCLKSIKRSAFNSFLYKFWAIAYKAKKRNRTFIHHVVESQACDVSPSLDITGRINPGKGEFQNRNNSVRGIYILFQFI